MNAATLRAACIEHDGYETPELNDRLYLHFKGFKKIENLEPYTGLKALWLESNGIGKIEGLDHLAQLRCLFLQQNMIKEIGPGLRMLTALQTLNLAQNHLRCVSDLDALPQLATLNLAHNALRDPEDITHLHGCTALTNLDLSNNNLTDSQALEPVLRGMSRIVALKLKGNPMVRSTRHYRKTLITWLPSLRHLDDRPVFDDERGATEAWARGGRQAEKEWREAYRQREQDKRREQRERFRTWQAEVRERRAKELAEYRAKVGDETAEMPVKKWVQYGTVSNESLDRMDAARRAVLIAEREAERIAKNGTTVVEVGARYWAERGAGEEGDGAPPPDDGDTDNGTGAGAGQAAAVKDGAGAGSGAGAVADTEGVPGGANARDGSDGEASEDSGNDEEPPHPATAAVASHTAAAPPLPPSSVADAPATAVAPPAPPARSAPPPPPAARSREPDRLRGPLDDLMDDEPAPGSAELANPEWSEEAKAEREWRVQESLRIYRARLKQRREAEKAEAAAAAAARSAKSRPAKPVLSNGAMPPPPALWFPKLDRALSKAVKLAKFDFKRAAKAVSVAVKKGVVKLPAGHAQTKADVVRSLTADACRLRHAFLKKAKAGAKASRGAVAASGAPRVDGVAVAAAAMAAAAEEEGPITEPKPVNRLLQGSFDAPLPFRDLKPMAPLPSMDADDDDDDNATPAGGAGVGAGAGAAAEPETRPLTREEIVASLMAGKGRGSNGAGAGVVPAPAPAGHVTSVTPAAPVVAVSGSDVVAASTAAVGARSAPTDVDELD